MLLPTLVDQAFDYLVPHGTPEGALVEVTLAGRKLVGAVWERGTVDGGLAPYAALPLTPAANGSPSATQGTAKPKKEFALKPVLQVLSGIPPLAKPYRDWVDWIAEFTLAPKGAVLSLCGLVHALKVPKKPLAIPEMALQLPELTAGQKDALAKLNLGEWHRTAATPKPILLDGVTGSGKTEMYFYAIAAALEFREKEKVASLNSELRALDSPSQVLILVPEIALTHQLLARFEKTFGSAPVVWHSRLTPVARARAWQAVARGAAPVVVGARSALFLPFKNLKLIVVDEEHDPSYKQEDGVLYHARDMAVVRAHFERIPIILASATPSLETLENVRLGKYRAITLPERFGAAGLPSVRLVDMKNTPPERGNFLSPTVVQAMLATLARGEQVLLFLNRRGYAPLLLCRGCGHRFECKNCSAWLVIHGKGEFRVRSSEFSKKEGLPSLNSGLWTLNSTLHCHHCGHREPMVVECPECKAPAEKLAPCGPGVERIAEEVGALFREFRVQSSEFSETLAGEAFVSKAPAIDPSPPRGEVGWGPGGAQVANHESRILNPTIYTLSSDESIAAETWEAIEGGHVDIIVGTQMVAKGHHFPRLTLVVVVDADVGLSGADLRAGERTYQLLHQLGGRAGRSDLAGSVLVQTYLPEHPVMQSLAAHDRDRLMGLEASERKAGGWPPYGQLAAILLDGVEEAKVRAAGQALARTAPTDARLKILGPAIAPMSKLRGQYRYRLLVKAEKGINLQRTLRAWLGSQKFSGVRMKVDVNPYYFL